MAPDPAKSCGSGRSGSPALVESYCFQVGKIPIFSMQGCQHDYDSPTPLIFKIFDFLNFINTFV